MYTSLECYDTFKVLNNFFMATVNSLIYLGNSKADIFFEENSTKCGRHKTLSAKEELFKRYINLAFITNSPAQCLSAFKIYIQIPDLQLTVMRYLLKCLLQNDPSQPRFSKYKLKIQLNR